MKKQFAFLIAIAMLMIACNNPEFKTPNFSYDGRDACITDSTNVSGNYVAVSAQTNTVTIHAEHFDVTATMDSTGKASSIVLKGCYQIVK